MRTGCCARSQQLLAGELPLPSALVPPCPPSPQAYEAAITARKEAAAAGKEGGGGGGGGGLPAGLKLEDPSVLLAPGARDGQTKVVREGGAGVAYAWDASK